MPKSDTNFNPRSPCGERPVWSDVRPARGISIHAPLAGSDAKAYDPVPSRSSFQSTLPLLGATGGLRRLPANLYFNPRSPCGERLNDFNNKVIAIAFQSTLPLRGATTIRGRYPRIDSDFNPRSPSLPLRGATRRHQPLFASYLFQSTLPLRGATLMA